MYMEPSLGPIELPVKLSPSAINNYDACKRKFYYSRHLRRTEGEEPAFFARGTEAHEVMEGIKGEQDVSKEAWSMASKMMKAANGMQLDITHHEITQVWKPTKNILFERRIDALGYDKNGFGIIIDWKTAARKWEVMSNGVAPKALTWQTPGYFLPPPQALLDEINWTDPWPTQMMYIVGPLWGASQVFELGVEDVRMLDIYDMFQDIEEDVVANTFRRSAGYNCTYCPFQDICWKVGEYMDVYELRAGEKI